MRDSAVHRNTPADDRAVANTWKALADAERFEVAAYLITVALGYLEQLGEDPGQALPPVLARRATDDGGHG